MMTSIRIVRSFGYTPMIKFLGPRTKSSHQTPSEFSKVTPSDSHHHPISNSSHTPGFPSIFISSLVYPQLT